MANPYFPLLFTPIEIGGLGLANRLVLTGHGTGMASGGQPTEQMVNYYAERAQGGVGLIMVGSQQVHPTSPSLTGLICNYDDAVIPGLQQIANAIHRYDTKCFGELSHMGLASSARPLALWSCSAVAEEKYGEVAHEMTLDEIDEIEEAYAAAAARCIAAGMDGVELQGGHGLLIQQFMSPVSNKRTDAYGGSLDGRLRFPIELVQRVRQRIGERVPFGMRVSADELIEGGLTLDDMREIVPRLVAAGRLDFVDVSAGNDGNLLSNMLHEPPMGIAPANLTFLAAGIKEVVDVPVIHATRINHPVLAERVLNEGLTDLVGMCRALIADPYLPAKARKGQVDDINPCVGCQQGCLGRLHSGRHITCVGNPVTGRESEWAELKPAVRRKKVVVVGGGVAGMEAALVAARRGHRVVLLEKEKALGGQVLTAAKAPTRDEFADLARHRALQLARAGVEVRLGVDATAETVLAEAPEAVVVATGATPGTPPVDGERPSVMLAEDVLSETAEPGQRVVVVDMLHDQRAVSVAAFLAERDREVQIVTDGPYVGHRLETRNFSFMTQRLFDKNVVFTPLSRVAALENGSVILTNIFTGAQASIEEVDSVVFVTARKAAVDLARALAGRVPELYTAGDCIAPRDVEAAILEGHRVGRRL